MFLSVNTLNFYVTICIKNTEVVILDFDVLGTRSHFWNNRKCDRPLIIFVNCYCIFKKTAHYLISVPLNFDYILNLLHNNHKR